VSGADVDCFVAEHTSSVSSCTSTMQGRALLHGHGNGFKQIQVLLVPCCCQFFNSLLCGNIVLLKKIVHADIALSASYKKCWTVEFTMACEGLRASNRYTNCVKAAIPLLLKDFVVDLHERLRALWRELDGADPKTHCGTLTNWLLIMRGWPRLSSQALQGALHICCLDTYSWNWVGMCFVTLLVFACGPIP